MIAVKVDQLFLSNMGFVVLLKGLKDERSLPIFIGAAEAQAIAIRMNGVELPRPLTHDLLKKLLDFMECRLMRIEVCDLKEGTFFARLILERDGTAMDLDCRPSDAIALALRCGAPVFVAGAIMTEAGRVIEQEPGTRENEEAGSPPDEARETEQKPTPLKILTRELDRAVQEERYEDAARLRDQIKHLNSPHSGN